MSESTAMIVLRIQQWLRDNSRSDGIARISAQDLQQFIDRLAQAEPQRDEALGLLREAHSRIRYDDGEDDPLYVKIDAHLRDTGE